MECYQNFVWVCLQETGKALHQMVVCTYKKQDDDVKKEFFLIGYSNRGLRRRKKVQRKRYDNPETCAEGLNVKWLLRNIRWHKLLYAEKLNLYDDALDEICDFMLTDVFDAVFADIKVDSESLKAFAKDCFDASIELVSAIEESGFYAEIAENATKMKENISNMYVKLELPPHLELPPQLEFEQEEEEDLDTQKVIDFLSSSNLRAQLQKELNMSKEKKISKFFLKLVIPFVLTHNFSADSGFEEMAPIMNLTADTSMVIIDNFESTPQAKNKNLFRVQMMEKVTPNKKENEKEVMDGSFVLI